MGANSIWFGIHLRPAIFYVWQGYSMGAGCDMATNRAFPGRRQRGKDQWPGPNCHHSYTAEGGGDLLWMRTHNTPRELWLMTAGVYNLPRDWITGHSRTSNKAFSAPNPICLSLLRLCLRFFTIDTIPNWLCNASIKSLRSFGFFIFFRPTVVGFLKLMNGSLFSQSNKLFANLFRESI